jgi:riboflavin kinase
MKVKGRVVSGKGSGRGFTELEWAKKQFVRALGFEPFPGTLNARLEETTNLDILEQGQCRAITIEPPDKNYHEGLVLQTFVNGVVRVAIVIPQIPNYDPHLVEIIAPVNLRRVLNLKDGDTITLEF